ncbi:response regulator [bacterium]|nr:response regulator [bacterium]
MEPIDKNNLAKKNNGTPEIETQKDENKADKKRILIIDDERQVRVILKKMLGDKEFDITTASDGNEGMILFNENPFDLVITDIIMPEKEGIEVINELRANYPDVPIIAISGGGQNAPGHYLEVAKILGANAIFEKPIERKKILNAVKKSLKLQ